MNKRLIKGLLGITLILTSLLYLHYSSTDDKVVISQPAVTELEKVPLYYDIDNPEQAMILEDGEYQEITING